MTRDERIQAAAEVVAEMAAEFSDLARLLSDGESLPDMLDRLVKVAAQAVIGTEHCAITLVQGQSLPHTVAASDELPIQVDKLQYQLQEGPCLDALVVSDVTLTNDLAADRQWPVFAARAVAETGVRAMLSFRLYLTADARAALNFYSSRSQAFPLSAIATGSIFASYGSMAMLAAIHEERALNLTRAVESNREIGTAIGILMATKKVTQQDAFDQLRRASQNLHRRLRDIAAEVNITGELPELVGWADHKKPSSFG
jgi:ANTAR domain/GAF domain